MAHNYSCYVTLLRYKFPFKYLHQLDIDMKQDDLEEVFDPASSKVLFIIWDFIQFKEDWVSLPHSQVL